MYKTDSAHPDPALAARLRHLYSLRGGPSIDLTIRPAYYDLLARLGNPHQNLPPVIHVAGTNGKGSIIATLRAVLEAAGHKVHVYTSPHLLKFNERIVLAGQEIVDALLSALLDEVTEKAAGLNLTFFEITTAMAFAAFSRQPADILLLETGLGGRLDCTNVVEKPAATIIAPIGRDHAEYLGDTLEKIALEKAGIIKPGCPCIIAPQDNPAIDSVLHARAEEYGAPLYRCGHEWNFMQTEKGLSLTFCDEHYDLPAPALTGVHQYANAATALAALLALPDFKPTTENIAQGLRNVRWPGRLQKISCPLLPPGWELWIDGAHNEHAARALAAQMKLWREQDGQPAHLIAGLMKTKNAGEFFDILKPHAASITTLSVPGEETLAHDAHDLARLCGGTAAASLDDALAAITATAAPAGRIIVAGSLYLVGHILQRGPDPA